MLSWLALPVGAFRSSLVRKKGDVVARDESIIVLCRRQTRNVIGMFSNELRGVRTGVIDDASRDLLAIRGDDGNHLTVFEFIFDAGNARVQETRILFRDGVPGAFIDVNASANRR